MKRLIDITPRVSVRTAVWPGTPRTGVLGVADGDGGLLQRGLDHDDAHLGRTPTPLHFDSGAPAVGSWTWRRFWALPGRGRDWLPGGGRGSLAASRSTGWSGCSSRRHVPDFERWNDDFAYIDAALVRRLGKRGVKLVGIDTPSVDPFHSKDLPAHHALLECGMRNLEGLDLSERKRGSTS